MIYAVTSGILAVYLMLTYFLSTFLGISGSDLWILRGGLALVGFLTAIAYLWYYMQSLRNLLPKRSGGGAGGGASPASAQAAGAGEVDLVLRDAEARMAASELGVKVKLGNLPVVLVLGRQGSVKTSSVVHAGLEAELLAGQVYQESDTVPTPAANVWYTRRAAFVEAGGGLLRQAHDWRRLLKRLRPRALKSQPGVRGDAPRAVLLCVSCEEFFGGAGAPLEAVARELRARLEEVSNEFGVRLPVYVLFTKTDRIAYFAEFVRNLSAEEAGQAVGVTLAVEEAQTAGVYAERQSQRLTEAFNRLFAALCDRRPDILVREHDPQNLHGAYEFPRELRKLRAALVQFLVDVCRPSQLRAGPFLRGFYFSGVRAVITQEVPVETPLTRQRHSPAVSAATGVFAGGQAMAAPEESIARTPSSRKVPQWCFLSHLFSDVLLGDTAALGASVSRARTSLWQKVLLIAGAALCLIWSIGLIVSFVGNRRLEADVIEAIRGIGAAEATGGELASVGSLERLETVRRSLETLTRYRQEGPPWRLRWGLYIGEDLYPAVRRSYYSRFHQLLFGSAQTSLVHTLQRLPAQPAPTDEYQPVYDTLKAYLITTSHPDKSTRLFLTPVLMRHWLSGRDVDAARKDLAGRQFDFYAEDLKSGNPFSSEQDTLAVERGRAYLAQFAGIERVYQYMLAEASRQNPTVNFNRQFPGSEQVVVNNRDIAGAFTKGGWEFIQKALRSAERFFGGERWVLGDQAVTAVDRVELEKQLTARYLNDFLTQWREYLRATSVVRYRSLDDAARKLGITSGNQSPLLASLWLASQHTDVPDETVKQAFQPVQYVVPAANKDRYIGDSNTGYMNALVGLQASVDQAAASSGPARNAAVDQINMQATGAKVVTRQVAQNFRIDPQANVGGTVQALLEAPILYAEALVRALGPAELNARGQSLCTLFRALLAKYPFRSEATAEATLAELAYILQPGTGALWAFYEESLREHLVRQGSLFVANPASRIRLTPEFVTFFNRAAAFADAVYPGGSAQPRFSYTVTLQPPAGMESLSLIVDNQMLTAGRGGPATLGFVWPGPGAQQVRFQGRFGGSPDLTFSNYQGLWAVFRFFGDADRSNTSGNVTRLEWVPRQGRAGQPITLPDGSPLTVRFDVQAAAPVFQKGYFGGLSCVSTVAR